MVIFVYVSSTQKQSSGIKIPNTDVSGSNDTGC